MSFNEDKCSVLHLERSNPKQQHRLGTDGLRSSSAARDLGMVAGSELKASQRCVLAGKVVSSHLGYTSYSTVSKSRNLAISVYLALSRPHLEYCNQFWSPQLEKLGRVQWSSLGLLGGWRTWHMKKGWRNQVCSAWRRESSRGI